MEAHLGTSTNQKNKWPTFHERTLEFEAPRHEPDFTVPTADRLS